jgi:hypothetical protein
LKHLKNIRLQHALLLQHLLAEIVHHSSHGVDNGHDLLVGNGGGGDTSAAPGTQQRGHGA